MPASSRGNVGRHQLLVRVAARDVICGLFCWGPLWIFERGNSHAQMRCIFHNRKYQGRRDGIALWQCESMQ